MALFKCKMCGGSLEIAAGTTVIECEYCGTQQTLPKLDDEKRANMYDRANHFRRNNEFDKAMGIYEQILNEDGTDAEAYWSLVLCRYGIEYVEDPSTKRRIPTVNRAQYTSILADEDYKSALANADTYQKSIYELEAKAIDEIQKGILAISQKEEPFDVFICYKESDNNGRRTPDSVLAQELYFGLKNEGFKVFFARITLEDKLGSAYEPYIFAALNSAKVMVVLGTRPEFFNAVWVKNEWSRYLALIKQGQKKMLIPAYKDMDPYNLPEEFSHLQAQDMSKLGFMQDLIRGIKKIVKADEPKQTVVKETVVKETVSAGATNTAALLKRAFMFLEDGDWKSADEYCEKVLDIDPENAQAYLGKLMADLQVKNQDDIKTCYVDFPESNNFKKAKMFADDTLNNTLNSYIEYFNKHIAPILQQLKPFEYKAWPNPTKLKITKLKNKNISSVTIPSCVVCIEEYVFMDANNIKRVNITDIAAWCNIEFSNMHSNPININVDAKLYLNGNPVTDLVIPDGVTKIGNDAFNGNDYLTSVTIPESVSSIGDHAFSSCENLTSVTINYGVTKIGNGAFEFCFSLSNLTIPNSVTNIGDEAFASCDNLPNVVIPNSVTRIGVSAFSYCTELQSVTIPDSVTEIEKRAFANCYNLSSITIPSSITSIQPFTFADCKKLSNIYISDIEAWCSIGLEYASHPASYSTDAKLYLNGELITNLVIPDGVTRINNYAFFRCTSITSITIPDSVTSIGDRAFSGCTNLRKVTQQKGIVYGDAAFEGCDKLNGCYVATCVYGSYDCPQVWTLRRFRDDTLGSTWYGRLFIRTYYAVSPTLVKWFGKTNWFKKLWRGKLDRMVAKLQSNGVEDTPYEDKNW